MQQDGQSKISFRPNSESAFKKPADVACIKKILHDPSKGYNGLDSISDMQASTKSCVDQCTTG